MSRLANKVVIVTGAAQGIGAELARHLAKHGARVVAADVLGSEDVTEGIAAEGGRALTVHCDVTSVDSIDAAVNQAVDEFGGVDAVVNNAALFGNLQLTSLLEIDVAEWDRVMAVNARGPWLMARRAIPEMRTRGGGSIVNVASNRVFQGYPNMLHYDASKGAVVAMTRSMAREVGEWEIRVNAIAPGLTMSESVLKKDGIEERAPLVAARRPLSRDQMPEDVAGAVTFLISDDSSFVTGQTLIVDGGSVMR